MSASNLDNLDPNARGLRLYKHDTHDRLIACELVMFDQGHSAINTVLRRAALAGVVKCEPFDDRMDYFADVYTADYTTTQSILLDRHSYAALKNHWMRCKLDRLE